MNIIETRNLSIQYRSGYNTVLAVDKVNLSIKQNDYLCIVGNNGSGKSSLVKAICGLVPACSGEIKTSIKRSEMSYLSQEICIQSDFPATVKEVVLCGTQKVGKFNPFYTKDDYNRADFSMRLLEISSLMNRRFGQLSGGQKQRVLLARSICKTPKVLVLDEPFSGLDISITESLYKTLSFLNSKMNTCIVMVTHDQDDVQNYAKHVAILNKSIEFYGTKDQWLKYRKCGIQSECK